MCQIRRVPHTNYNMNTYAEFNIEGQQLCNTTSVQREENLVCKTDKSRNSRASIANSSEQQMR